MSETANGIRIAIDGPGSSGKGTVAQSVAQALGYRYIDTGAMYRAVALAARRKNIGWKSDAIGGVARAATIDFAWDGTSLRTTLEGEDVSEQIRAEEIGRGASDVASVPEVRAALLEHQRALGRRGGVVMDGRDIGTVVLPDAELKVFVDASLDERARRRALELEKRGEQWPLERVREDLRERDRQDASRIVAPLKQAADAVYLDTTGLSPDAVRDRILALARERGARPRTPAVLDGGPTKE
jgi:cytidylate kinase